MNRSILGAAWLALALAATPAAAACPPEGHDVDRLQALKAAGFAVEDPAERGALALGLLDCLADPDPALRDGLAYEALTTWLRSDALDADTRRALLDTLLPWIAPDAGPGDGFRAPFAALALSEVARTDRIAAWLDPAARDALVEAAAAYVASVDDYRGFDAAEGWRHGVAHGADLLMQLALNPALVDAQKRRLLDAVARQVAPARRRPAARPSSRRGRSPWHRGRTAPAAPGARVRRRRRSVRRPARPGGRPRRAAAVSACRRVPG